MRRTGLFIAFLAFLAFILPSLPAQDAKKDAGQTEKKDEKKDPEKKDDAKKAEPKKPPEKLVYGSKFVTKIISLNADSSREFTVEKQEVDPKKVEDLQKWQATRMYELNVQQVQASTQKDAKARINALVNYQKAYNTYLSELAKRQNNVYTPKPMEVRATDNAKVRSMLPPVEFDELGFQKKWTKKELEERRDKTGLPGYGVDFDALKTGQMVEVYLAKQAKAATKTPTKKKGPDDDDPPAAKASQEFVLIVILPGGGK